MVPSRTLIELLKQVESLRLRPYDDQTDQEISAWVPGATVGYGHLIPQAEWRTFKGGISVVQANALFERDQAESELVTQEAWRKRALHLRLMEGLGRLLERWL